MLMDNFEDTSLTRLFIQADQHISPYVCHCQLGFRAADISIQDATEMGGIKFLAIFLLNCERFNRPSTSNSEIIDVMQRSSPLF